jgi:Ni/Co efflux regulator RcnB
MRNHRRWSVAAVPILIAAMAVALVAVALAGAAAQQERLRVDRPEPPGDRLDRRLHRGDRPRDRGDLRRGPQRHAGRDPAVAGY